jgi:hypothetical protein
MTPDWPQENKTPWPCACRFIRAHDFAYPKQVEWCALHAAERDELAKFREAERDAAKAMETQAAADAELASFVRWAVLERDGGRL